MKTDILNTVLQLCLAGAFFVSFSTAHALTINLTPSVAVLDVGDVFTIDVSVAQVFAGRAPLEEVLGFGFDVTVSNPTLVGFLGATVAAPFDDDSALFPNTDVAGSVFPGIPNLPANETFVLATLSFQALAVGLLSVGIESDLLDPNEGLIYVLSDPADLSAAIDLQIPTPGTLSLTFLGFYVLWGKSVKRISER